ncbi:unnamed protein product [Ixodes pacificus]
MVIKRRKKMREKPEPTYYRFKANKTVILVSKDTKNKSRSKKPGRNSAVKLSATYI